MAEPALITVLYCIHHVCLVEVEVVGVDGSIEGDGDHLGHLVLLDVARDPGEHRVKTIVIGFKTVGVIFIRQCIILTLICFVLLLFCTDVV